MKKTFVLLAVAGFAASATAAETKQMTPEQAMEQNRKSWELVKQGLPLVLPSWALPIYFGTHMDQMLKDKGTKKK